MNTNPLPCPVCNSTLVKIKSEDNWKWVECEKCGAVGFASLDEEKAIERWNKNIGVKP